MEELKKIISKELDIKYNCGNEFEIQGYNDNIFINIKNGSSIIYRNEIKNNRPTKVSRIQKKLSKKFIDKFYSYDLQCISYFSYNFLHERIYVIKEKEVKKIKNKPRQKFISDYFQK